MSKFELSKVLNSARYYAMKNAPSILTAFGVCGSITAAGMVADATIKAVRLVDDESKKRNVKLTKKEMVGLVWKLYIPPVVMEAVAIGCLFGANSESAKRNAALTAAYTLSETAREEYREKVIETIGEKKEQAVMDKVAKEHMEQAPIQTNQIVITEKGKTLCFDTHSGRYFRSDIDKIRGAVNKLNRRLLEEMYVSLNDFYYELGLKTVDLGDRLGWNVDDGLIDVYFSAQLSEDEEPCIVLEYRIAPRYEFSKFS